MNGASIKGAVHSIQTLGTLDGPGVRFVVFLQGCPLRCGCCHNPDTWERDGGTQYTAHELADRAARYRTYFGTNGGVTLSGGEPLLQAEFGTAFFRESHNRGINTCLDTSGCVLNESVKAFLLECDRVLLDIKYHTDALYREYVGCGIDQPLRFLAYLNEKKIPTTLRQVVIPTLNDTVENDTFLKELVAAHSCVDQVELLPFKKICTVKYDQMGIPFRFADIPTPDREEVKRRQAELNKAKKGSR